MRVGIRARRVSGKICTALLLEVMLIALIIPGSDVVLSQDTAQSLKVNTASPVELILTDPQGRRTGFDPLNKTSFRDIPASQYSASVLCDEPNYSRCQPPFKSLHVADTMDGQYTVDVIGTGTGDFTVVVRISDEATGNWITHLYSGTTAPGHTSRLTFPGRLNIFAAFEATLKINSASKAFEVNGTFTLGPRGTISPVTQPVSIELHNFVSTIPSGSFRQTQQGTFIFAGVIQGFQLAAELTRTGGKNYTFRVRGAGVPEPSGLPGVNPVRVGFAIGNNGGDTSVNGNFLH